MLLSRYRKAIDTFAPPLGRSYRLLRDATSRRRAIQTPYGFSLVGDPTMAAKDWEADEIAAFLELIEGHDAVVDIGANVGMYSCLAAKRGKPTLAFEPSTRNLKYLYRNLWDNGFRDVEVFPIGLARKPGLGRIYGYGGIASFVPGWAQARGAQSVLVPLTSLDTVLAGRFQGKRLLIKLDVEGFELEVLSGAAKTLDLTPGPTWLVEILLHGEVIPAGMSRKFSQTFEMFREHGYKCRKLDAKRTPVERNDVSRWVCQGSVDGETHDFLFSAD
jgi:FkbM family methyltransferase